MDSISPEKRSANMAKIASRDTEPEKLVRRLLHKRGYRYRLHVKNLPGKPDLVFPRKRKVVFVHGCFWHRHNCKNGCTIPATRRSFWEDKFQRNVERDQKNIKALKQRGWKVFVVWECQLADEERVVDLLEEFLSS